MVRPIIGTYTLASRLKFLLVLEDDAKRASKNKNLFKCLLGILGEAMPPLLFVRKSTFRYPTFVVHLHQQPLIIYYLFVMMFCKYFGITQNYQSRVVLQLTKRL